jgi:1-acyl-sn-glycerol-3-phosphate acyltransferase
MGEKETMGNVLKLDVEKVLYSKNPGLKKIIPNFLVNYLKKIVHQDELNELLEKKGHLQNAEFIKAALEFMGITYRKYGTENIPRDGRYIFVSNHPLGGLDGLVFINELSKYYNDLKFPVNDILMNIENLSGIFLPINKHGSQEREFAIRIEQAYASNCQILYFPAGLCSRRKNGIIKDLKWQKSFITKAIQHKRDIVPAFFSGRNSSFFYKFSNVRKFLGIKANLEMLYLANEMFEQKNKEICLIFGEPVPWQTFDKSKTINEWVEWVKAKSYALESVMKVR